MLPCNRWAYKEWAVIIAAILAGKQSLLVRKGGIHEGRAGFHPQHPEFWLYPTRFHQQPEALIPEAREFFPVAQELVQSSGKVCLPGYVEVCAAHYVQQDAVLHRLEGYHFWSHITLQQRFRYRTSGLWVLVVRAYRCEPPYDLPEKPEWGGCLSWVDLSQELPVTSLRPVLDDQAHAQTLERIQRVVTEIDRD
ncbi:MAG: hypothetical protein KatS3mg113_0354 [Planctomycetaceae bacterium]|nr:MAG: hypothetical protein KatS3mg113_0354 [Planctomycetaceae bacterium]